MAFDHSKLKGRIVEKFGSQTAFADYLNIAKQTVCAKLNGNIGFTREDIIEWSRELDIDGSDIGTYFFTEKV